MRWQLERMSGPSLSQRAQALVAAQRPQEAVALLSSPEGMRDGDALFLFGIWRMVGDIVPRDLSHSRALFGHSADAGNESGAIAYTAFLANGTGGPSAWVEAMQCLQRLASTNPMAARQRELIAAMNLTVDGDPVAVPQGRPISEKPQITLFRQLLTARECTYLIETAEPMMISSDVIDPATGRFMRHPIRTSDAAAFPLIDENPAIHALNRRIAAATDTLVAQGEPVQILRYRPGQEYKAHYDALPETDNQRRFTVLVYLNEDYGGGETHFFSNGMSIRGQTGDAILFVNADSQGQPDAAARHAGLPVTKGAKYLASRWIRARPLDLSGGRQ